jgi:hypothetical protein
LRLLLAALADTLMINLRRHALAATELAQDSASTARHSGARRIGFSPASSRPTV